MHLTRLALFADSGRAMRASIAAETWEIPYKKKAVNTQQCTLRGHVQTLSRVTIFNYTPMSQNVQTKNTESQNVTKFFEISLKSLGKLTNSPYKSYVPSEKLCHKMSHNIMIFKNVTKRHKSENP